MSKKEHIDPKVLNAVKVAKDLVNGVYSKEPAPEYSSMNAEKNKTMHEKTKELIDALPDIIQSVFENDETFINFLKAASHFHRYSSNNALLIWSQKPDATRIGSYTTWKSLGRLIRKNERGIRILCPHTFKVQNPETGLEETKIGWHTGYVWDISQTYGEDLPDICAPLDADVVGYENLLDVLIRISPVPVEFIDHIDSGARGYYSPAEKKIVICEGSEAEVISVLLHEQAHCWMNAHDTEEKLTKHHRECEAEAVSYICCTQLGIENATAPQYIASWSSDKSVSELRECLTTIQQTADHILDLIEDEMNNSLQKEPAA